MCALSLPVVTCIPSAAEGSARIGLSINPVGNVLYTESEFETIAASRMFQ